MRRDSASFWDKGTEVPSLSWEKGTTGQAKNLAKGQDRPGQLISSTGRGTKRDRAEEDVLKQEKDVHNQHVKAPVPIGLNCLHFARA